MRLAWFLALGCLATTLSTSPLQSQEARLSVTTAVDRLVQAARVYDEKAMAEAAALLVDVGETALPALEGLLTHVDGNVRWQAIVAMEQMAVPAETVLRSLKKGATDSDPDVRAQSVLALMKLFPGEGEAKQVITKATRDPHALVRSHAWCGMWRLEKNPLAIPELLTLSQSSDGLVAPAAAAHLGTMGDAAFAQVLKEFDATNPNNISKRFALLRVFAALGPAAAPASARLQNVVASAERRLALAALRALVRMGEPSLAALLELWQQKATPTRLRALLGIGQLGVWRPELESVVLEALRSENETLHRAGLSATRGLRRATPAMIEEIVPFLESSDADLRGEAVSALASLGTEARVAMSALTRVAAEDPKSYLREAADRAVRNIEAAGSVGDCR